MTSKWPYFIPLTKGKVALVSPEDVLATLRLASWYYHVSNKNYPGYGATRTKNGFLYLHHFIASRMGLIVVDTVDHRNGDSLDNRRDNLRLASHSVNGFNRGVQSNNRSSGVKGVTWHHEGHKWMAQLVVRGKRHYLGLFNTVEEAEQAYLSAVIKLGADAR